MNRLSFILAIAYLMAGCSSNPVKEQPRAEQSKVVAQSVKPAPSPPKVEPKVSAQPVEKPRVVADPLSDPSSPLAKRSIYYDFDNSGIKDEYKSLIRAHGAYLAGNRGVKIRIEGNCDERGSREYNLALGQRRADNVKAALMLSGATEGQIDTASWGEEKPKANGHDDSAWAENRRSDIVYEKTR